MRDKFWNMILWIMGSRDTKPEQKTEDISRTPRKTKEYQVPDVKVIDFDADDSLHMERDTVQDQVTLPVTASEVPEQKENNKKGEDDTMSKKKEKKSEKKGKKPEKKWNGQDTNITPEQADIAGTETEEISEAPVSAENCGPESAGKGGKTAEEIKKAEKKAAKKAAKKQTEAEAKKQKAEQKKAKELKEQAKLEAELMARKKKEEAERKVAEAENALESRIEAESRKSTKRFIKGCYDNRELSWLKFNARVLEEAEDDTNPFCERLSFASIYQSNLDEFFKVRVGSLYDQMLLSPDYKENKTNMTCQEQLFAIFNQVKELGARKDACYAGLKAGLAEEGVEICSYAELDDQDRQYVDAFFAYELRPLLSPQIVGKKQPFPFLKDKEIYAVVVFRNKNNKKKLGIVPCNVEVFPRMVRLPEHENRFMLIEEIILHYIDSVFDKYEIESKSLIRIIRNADIDPDEDEDNDFRQVMEQMIRRRRRLTPIKLEYTRMLDESVINTLCKYLELKKKHVFHSEAPLDLSFFSDIRDLLRSRKELYFEKFVPQKSPDFDMDRKIMEQIEEKDRFLFFPYDDIAPFLKLLQEAAVDPDVLSIKMTLYRVARNSKIVDALIQAAENGKDVDVLVELRARFDEENNIGWSRRLESSGCRILYGLDKLKVHSKLCLITKRQNGHISYITQIGTGNYNEKTAALYTDFSLMTAKTEIGAEAAEVFRRLYLGETVSQTRHLMVAPRCLKNKVLDKMDGQIALAKEGKPAYIGAKMNSLTDRQIIEKLVEASQANVRVELLVRGACCIVAGVPGLTEHITVRSIVGRYLEHSRIYIFGTDDVYISSADFMTRNTTRRVEVATPIYDPDIKARVLEIFHILMSDNVKARTQQSSGEYTRIPNGEPPLIAQNYFMTPENRLSCRPLEDHHKEISGDGPEVQEELKDAASVPEQTEMSDPVNEEHMVKTVEDATAETDNVVTETAEGLSQEEE